METVFVKQGINWVQDLGIYCFIGGKSCTIEELGNYQNYIFVSSAMVYIYEICFLWNARLIVADGISRIFIIYGLPWLYLLEVNGWNFLKNLFINVLMFSVISFIRRIGDTLQSYFNHTIGSTPTAFCRHIEIFSARTIECIKTRLTFSLYLFLN